MVYQRQLAAIMFTDIEGYTATMQMSEQKALRLKDRHREILQKTHAEYNGRIIQYYGDGTLSIFQSAVESVQCALEMQLAFRQKPEVPVRIGIHSGDVIFDEEQQVFGDGVNLTSRIESLSVSGAVLLSDKVKDEISNHPTLRTVSMGIFQFKNINRAVEVFALQHEGIIVPAGSSLKGKTVEKNVSIPAAGSAKGENGKSIAVLPFINLSNNDETYFSEGIGEELINSLSQVKGLKVASRSSSFRFNSREHDLKEVGDKLGVTTVLQGSVRKQGTKLRIGVQLINIADGFQLWSETYDRNSEDIFAIQQDVALAVTEKLKLSLLDKEKEVITRNHTRNPEAYELYLKGKYFTNKRGGHIITGLHCFQLATDLDPEFALAHTGYADACLMAAFYGLINPRELLVNAKKAAEKALSINPALCEPYCTLGCLYVFEWNWKEAEKNYYTCFQRNPVYTQAHYWYGSLYLGWVKGDFFRAETHSRIALELEPSSAVCYGLYSTLMHTSGKFREALEAAEKGLALDETSFICRMNQGWAHLFLHEYNEGVMALEDLVKRSGNYHLALFALIIAYCLVWKFQKASQLMDDLRRRSENEFIPGTVMGLSAAYLDDLDEAFIHFERAYQDKDPMLLSLKYDHWVPDSLKHDPRFDMLLERIGFPVKESKYEVVR
jgi:adenylate cyclase